MPWAPDAARRTARRDEVRGPMAAVLWASGVVQDAGLAKTRGVGTLAENSGWAARFVLAEARGLVLAQAQELALDAGVGAASHK